MHMVYPFQLNNVIVQITTEKHHRTKTKEKSHQDNTVIPHNTKPQ